MTPIRKTISGDTPGAVTLIAISRNDTGLAVGISLPQSFSGSGGSYRFNLIDPLGDCPSGYSYTWSLTWADGTSIQFDDETVSGSTGLSRAPIGGGSVFEQLFPQAGLDGLYETFGVLGSYTAPDGTAVGTLTLRIEREATSQTTGGNGQLSELTTAQIMARQSELAKPVRGARFTVRGADVWTIETTPFLVHGQWECACKRSGLERHNSRRAS